MKILALTTSDSPFAMLAMPGDNLGLALLIVGLVTFIALVGVWGHQSRKRVAAAWADFAARHQFEHTPGVRHVRGTIDGGRVFVMYQDVARNALGTEYRDQHQRVPGFVVRVELLSQAPEKMLIMKKPLIGSTEVPIGDPTFDKKVFVQCEDKEAARAWLASPSRRAAILKAVLEHKMTILGPIPDRDTHDGFPGTMTQLFWYSHSGYKPRVDWFKERFQEITHLAQEIDETCLPPCQSGLEVAVSNQNSRM